MRSRFQEEYDDWAPRRPFDDRDDRQRKRQEERDPDPRVWVESNHNRLRAVHDRKTDHVTHFTTVHDKEQRRERIRDALRQLSEKGPDAHQELLQKGRLSLADSDPNDAARQWRNRNAASQEATRQWHMRHRANLEERKRRRESGPTYASETIEDDNDDDDDDENTNFDTTVSSSTVEENSVLGRWVGNNPSARERNRVPVFRIGKERPPRPVSSSGGEIRPGAVAVRGIDYEGEASSIDYSTGSTRQLMGSLDGGDSSPKLVGDALRVGVSPDLEENHTSVPLSGARFVEQDIRSTQESKEDEPEAEPENNRKKWIIAIIIGIMVLAAIGAIVGVLFGGGGGGDDDDSGMGSPVAATTRTPATMPPTQSFKRIVWDLRSPRQQEQAGYGRSVDLSGSGNNVLVVGGGGNATAFSHMVTPRSWRPISPMFPQGDEVALSVDGRTLAVRTPSVVQVYRRVDGTTDWLPLGNPITTDLVDVTSMDTISLSDTFLAVGGTGVGPLGQYARVRVFVFDSQAWIPRGGLIEELGSYGVQVSVSMNGTFLAVGNTFDGSDGAVALYQFVTANWNRLSDDDDLYANGGPYVSIGGSAAAPMVGVSFPGNVVVYDPMKGSLFGESISLAPLTPDRALLSVAATSIAIAWEGNVGVWVFSDFLDRWEPRGNVVSFTGTISSVAMSNDGRSYAVGIAENGFVAVYDALMFL